MELFHALLRSSERYLFYQSIFPLALRFFSIKGLFQATVRENFHITIYISLLGTVLQ